MTVIASGLQIITQGYRCTWCLVFVGLCFTLHVYGINNAQADGEDIFQRGLTAAGNVTFKNHDATAPSTLYACKNCHGIYGQGKKEGGSSAPEITAFRLTSSAARNNDGGYKRAPYTTARLKRALMHGINSSGKALSSLMPRYNLTEQELQQLIEYLAVVDQVNAPGVTQDQLKIAVFVPTTHTYTTPLKKALNAYVANINKDRGIYGRQISLDYFDLAEPINSNNYFFGLVFNTPQVAISNKPSASSKPSTRWLNASLPSLTLFTPNKRADNQLSLYTKPSHFKTILADYTAQNNLNAINDLTSNNRKNTEINPYRPILLSTNSKTFVQEFRHFSQSQNPPVLFLNGKLNGIASSTHVKNYPNVVFGITAPTPRQVKHSGITHYKQLSQVYNLPQHHLTEQLWGLSLASTLVETLQLAGKHLDQAHFYETLTTRHNIINPFGPNLAFSPITHTGAAGAEIVVYQPLNTQGNTISSDYVGWHSITANTQ